MRLAPSVNSLLNSFDDSFDQFRDTSAGLYSDSDSYNSYVDKIYSWSADQGTEAEDIILQNRRRKIKKRTPTSARELINRNPALYYIHDDRYN